MSSGRRRHSGYLQGWGCVSLNRFLGFLSQQEAFAVECGNTARTGGGDGLAVVGVLHVARGEDALDRGLRGARLGADVAFGIELELSGEELRVGMVTDGEEEARDVDRALLSVVPAQQGARYAGVVAQHLGGVVLEEHLDVLRAEDSLLHGLRGAQVGLADDHVDLAAQRGEVGGLLAGRVAWQRMNWMRKSICSWQALMITSQSRLR